MPTLNAELAGSESNSYVDADWADAYADNQYWADEWTALTDDEKAISLISATKWLETLPWGSGTRCEDDQRLSWPRKDAKCDGALSTCAAIPYRIQAAEVELAHKLALDPDAITGGDANSSPAGTFVSKQQLGDLVIEYNQFRGDVSSSCDDCDNPAVIKAFPWLDDLLGCYLGSIASGAGRVLTRECCNEMPTYPMTF